MPYAACQGCLSGGPNGCFQCCALQLRAVAPSAGCANIRKFFVWPRVLLLLCGVVQAQLELLHEYAGQYGVMVRRSFPAFDSVPGLRIALTLKIQARVTQNTVTLEKARECNVM